MEPFSIGNKQVGEGRPALVIAEIAQAHDGSLNIAHSFIDSIAAAGADAVKFQTHIAKAESSPQEQWRVPFSRQDASRFDYWRRMEFTREQWRGLKTHAEEKELIFLSSPFSLQGIELLESIGIQAWKIASGEVRNELLLDRMLQTRLPILLSSGMSSWAELAKTVNRIQTAGLPLLLMQCTSAYPCPPERTGLNVLAEMRDRYHCATGLSDHSGTIWPALAAVTLGAKAVELHVTWDRAMFGPDAVASVTFAELKQLVEGIRSIERMLANPVDKEAEAQSLGGMRQMFGQSLALARDLPADHPIAREDLASKKPLVGIPASEYQNTLGRRTARALKEGEFLHRSDLKE
jgi:N-acetylneuraminate synthase